LSAVISLLAPRLAVDILFRPFHEVRALQLGQESPYVGLELATGHVREVSGEHPDD
jgi:hypothetical protein